MKDRDGAIILDGWLWRLRQQVATWPHLSLKLHLLPWEWLLWRVDWITEEGSRDEEDAYDRRAGYIQVTLHLGPIEFVFSTNLPLFEWIRHEASPSS